MASLNEFRSNFFGVRPNRFMVQANWPSGVPSPPNVNDLFIYVKGADLPGSTIGTINVAWQGRVIKFSGERNYSDWVINVYDSNVPTKDLRTGFERWMEVMDGRKRQRADQVGCQYCSGPNKHWRKVLQVRLQCGLDGRIAQLPAHRVNRLKQIRRQDGAQGVNVFVQLGHRSHADDGTGHLPLGVAKGQRHLGGREAMLASQCVVAARRFQRFDTAPALLAHRLINRNATLGRGLAGDAAIVVLAGQQAKTERRISQQRNTQAVHGLVQPVVYRAVDQAVRVLHGGNPRQTMLLCKPHKLVHAVR